MKLLPKKEVQKKAEEAKKLKSKNQIALTTEEKELDIARKHVAQQKKELIEEYAQFKLIHEKEISLLQSITDQLKTQNSHLTTEIESKKLEIENSKNDYTSKLEDLAKEKSKLDLLKRLLDERTYNTAKELNDLAEKKKEIEEMFKSLENKEQIFHQYLTTQENRLSEITKQQQQKEAQFNDTEIRLNAITELNRRDRIQIDAKEKDLERREILLASRQAALKAASRKLNL